VLPPLLHQQLVEKEALPEAVKQLKPIKPSAATCNHRLCIHLAPDDFCLLEDADDAIACSSG